MDALRDAHFEESGVVVTMNSYPWCHREAAEDEGEGCLIGSRVVLLLLACAYHPILFGQAQPAGTLDVFLVIDNSGSMRPNDPTSRCQVLCRLSPPDCQ